MNSYELAVGYPFIDKSFQRLLPLFKEVFGMEEKVIIDFYNSECWDSSYYPFTYFIGESAVSNVAMYEINMIINGEREKVAGIQSVMTHPDYRNRGLMKELFLKLLQKVDREYKTAFLFTDIPELYFPYGFRILKEHYFITPYDYIPKHESTTLRRINFFSLEGKLLIKKKLNDSIGLSNKFTFLKDTHSFYINMLNPKFNKNIYYMENLDIVIIFIIENDTLKIFDLIGERIPPLEEICSHIPKKFNLIEFYFNPDIFGLNNLEVKFFNSPNYFMVRGSFPIENDSFMLKRTAEF